MNEFMFLGMSPQFCCKITILYEALVSFIGNKLAVDNDLLRL